jgi:hypothetical protein
MKTWTVSDISKAIPQKVDIVEFQDNKGEWQNFTLVITPDRIVFGGVCNVGFLESGYMIRDNTFSLDENLQELVEELETYYNDGMRYCNRIVFNERM